MAGQVPAEEANVEESEEQRNERLGKAMALRKAHPEKWQAYATAAMTGIIARGGESTHFAHKIAFQSAAVADEMLIHLEMVGAL